MQGGGAEEPRPVERSLAMATAAPLQPAAPHRGIRALLARHPLVSFFVLAFAGTWLFELPYVLSADGSGLLPFSSPLLGWTMPLTVYLGPFLAAFVMTGATEGREGVRSLLRRFVLWRVGLRWYLFVFLGIPAIAVLSVVVIPGVPEPFSRQVKVWRISRRAAAIRCPSRPRSRTGSMICMPF
jgi:hypothetical protein